VQINPTGNWERDATSHIAAAAAPPLPSPETLTHYDQRCFGETNGISNPRDENEHLGI